MATSITESASTRTLTAETHDRAIGWGLYEGNPSNSMGSEVPITVGSYEVVGVYTAQNDSPPFDTASDFIVIRGNHSTFPTELEWADTRLTYNATTVSGGANPWSPTYDATYNVTIFENTESRLSHSDSYVNSTSYSPTVTVMADFFLQVTGTDPSVDSFWTDLDLTPPANKAGYDNSYNTLAAVLTAAGASDTVYIAPGTYSEDLDWNLGTYPNNFVTEGIVVIDGVLDSSNLLTIQNAARTITTNQGRVVFHHRDGKTGRLSRQQGTGSLTIIGDLELRKTGTFTAAMMSRFEISGADISLTVTGKLLIDFTQAEYDSTPATAIWENNNGTGFGTLIDIQGGLYGGGNGFDSLVARNDSTVPATAHRVEINGGTFQMPRYLAQIQNSWSDTENTLIIKNLTLPPAGWEIASRLDADDNIVERGDTTVNFHAEGIDYFGRFETNAPAGIGYDDSSQYISSVAEGRRATPRRGFGTANKIPIVNMTDDWYNTWHWFDTQTIDTRVVGTMGLAYTSDRALVKRLSAQSYTDSTNTYNIAAAFSNDSVPGSAGATSWSDPDIVSDFITPALDKISRGHEIVIHGRTHAQLGYAGVFDIQATGTTLSIDVAGDSLTLAGTVSASFTLSDYDEIGELVEALAATPGVTCNFQTYTNGGTPVSADVVAEPESLADLTNQSIATTYEVLRDWSRVHAREVEGCRSDLVAMGFPQSESFIYPVGHMSNELIALMEDGTLEGGRQVYPKSSGTTVDQIESPYLRPLDQGYEPFRQWCINVEQFFMGADDTERDIKESVRRILIWCGWNGAAAMFYSHSLTDTVDGDGNQRWEWVIAAQKEFVDAGEAEYVTHSQAYKNIKAREGATVTTNGRGGNDRYEWTFTDLMDDLVLAYGGAAGSVSDASKTLNEREISYYGSLGYSGTYNERRLQFEASRL